MTTLPKEKPKSYRKKQSIETLKKAIPFLERESIEFVRKDFSKKYEHPAISSVKEANKIVVDKYKKKIKNIWGGMKHTYKYLRSPNDTKFIGHTDNKNK